MATLLFMGLTGCAADSTWNGIQGERHLALFPRKLFLPGSDPNVPTPNLVPGITRQVITSLEEAAQLCSASAQYNISYQLRFYPFL
jgi:hypothetical protein